MLPCKYRGERMGNGNYPCSCPALVVPSAGVPERVCDTCIVAKKYQNAEIVGPPNPIREAPAKTSSGAGTELATLLMELGVADSAGCGCGSKMRLMDKNGIQWCRQNSGVIADWLRKSAEKRSWAEKALFAVRAASFLDPLHPFLSLVNEALRRWDAKCFGPTE